MTKITWLAVLAALAPTTFACNPPPPDPINGCPAPDWDLATEHDDAITSDETFAAGPHHIGSSITITAKLTIDPCAAIEIDDSVEVTVGANGSIVGKGTAASPITIQSVGAGNGWTSIRAIGGTIRLAYTNVSGGGVGAGKDGGAFFAQHASDPKAPIAALSFDHVTITGSQSNGVVLRGTTFDNTSTALAIHGSANYPIETNPMAFGSIPDGDYTGNTSDAILVIGGVGNGVMSDTTMHDRGVPYLIGEDAPSADLRVGTEATGLATLTIEPGVTLAFAPSGLLEVEHYDTDAPATGALVARGTADKPIVFTSASASPLAGDWLGVWFASHPDPSDALDHVSISYAGKVSTTIAGCPLNTQAQAALLIVGYEPGASFLTNSIISDSGKDGVFRGWIGSPVDFSATNTFTNVPHCKQTNPPSAQGICGAASCE